MMRGFFVVVKINSQKFLRKIEILVARFSSGQFSHLIIHHLQQRGDSPCHHNACLLRISMAAPIEFFLRTAVGNLQCRL